MKSGGSSGGEESGSKTKTMGNNFWVNLHESEADLSTSELSTSRHYGGVSEKQIPHRINIIFDYFYTPSCCLEVF